MLEAAPNQRHHEEVGSKKIKGGIFDSVPFKEFYDVVKEGFIQRGFYTETILLRNGYLSNKREVIPGMTKFETDLGFLTGHLQNDENNESFEKNLGIKTDTVPQEKLVDYLKMFESEYPVAVKIMPEKDKVTYMIYPKSRDS